MNNHIYGFKVPQNPHFGDLNRHFKPNMPKIQIAIYSDLCIRLIWNLTGSCGQQQRLRVWPRTKSLLLAAAACQISSSRRKTISRWRTAAILKIDISPFAISQWKIIRFSWNFVHSSRFLTGWTSRDQKWKSCIRQTPSSTERISCYFKNRGFL